MQFRYAKNLDLLFQGLEKSAAKVAWVVIDEGQKVPAILDTVHRILENKKFVSPMFALTGSGARRPEFRFLLGGKVGVQHVADIIIRNMMGEVLLVNRVDVDWRAESAQFFLQRPPVFQLYLQLAALLA